MIRSLLRSSLTRTLLNPSRTVYRTEVYYRSFATEGKQSQDVQEAASDKTPDTEAQNSQPEAGADAQPEPSLLEQLQKQVEERDEQIAELNDRALRTLAEMENVRMIARRDVDTARKYAVVPFAKDLLSVADNLGLAIASVDSEQLGSDSVDPHLKGLHIGISATETELLKVFSKHGITRFGEVGDKFDPNKFQAMFEAPSPEHEPGTVINVTKVGYELSERILRPAEVGVSRET